MKSLYTSALFFLFSFSLFPSGSEEICNSLETKHTTFRNAIQYYKSEKYLESEIELSRLLLEADCDSIRIFKIFSLLRQGKESGDVFRKSDFADIRFRVLYEFTNLIQNRYDPVQIERSSSCFFPDCKLESLERSILFLSSIQSFDELHSSKKSAGETEVADFDRLQKLLEEEGIQIQEKSKNPYAAAILSGIVPGSGQVYSNQTAEGVTSAFVNFVMISASYAVYTINPMSLVFYLLTGSTLMIYSSNVVGAYAAANRNNNFWKYRAVDRIKKEIISLKILEQEILYKTGSF
ncbi:hypothetical protein [Leptospira adleri]|uniref:Uncharacterized protein n=1 Tax=Leptospira adleri TaxID=2023186 RepID=A0A2M9YL56_9LEPT|nr:hypothetical protein [Leptospira adleri]PJZ52289.1 hypothetical protein CH380_15390 [Leptospira adleri]PJZ63496.1 hypothetical protein CH376_02410 [Leptospira adleri]